MGYDDLVDVSRRLDRKEQAAGKPPKNPEERNEQNDEFPDWMDLDHQCKITEEGHKVNWLLILKMLDNFKLRWHPYHILSFVY